MKKKYVIGLFILLFISLVLLFLFYKNMNNKNVNKFKSEYENLNNQTNNEGKKHLNIDINKKNKMYYASFEDIMNVINGNGVIYFGFPECPWCRNIVPTLVDAANETSLEKIYYFNALSIRDTKSLDNKGNIITEKKGTEEYYQLIDKLKEFLGEYEGLNDSNIKRLYFPTVVFIKNGKIINVKEGSVSSQVDPYKELNNEQKDELKKIYTDSIHEVLGDLCDEKC